MKETEIRQRPWIERSFRKDPEDTEKDQEGHDVIGIHWKALEDMPVGQWKLQEGHNLGGL